MVASSKKKAVAFEGNEDDDDSRDKDDYDEVSSEDDEEIFKTRSNHCFNDNIGLSLLEEHLNETSNEGNLMVLDWKDSTVDVVSVTVGDGLDTVIEMLC
jgi:hypothetical protein